MSLRQAGDQVLIQAWIDQVRRNLQVLRASGASGLELAEQLREEGEKLGIIVKVARRQARLQGAPNLRGLNHG